ncbi:TonB-dependent receptor [Novosphingobium sp. Rr 2-17]|uniref:TonB-dependent receptor n=1 Tax=Novosphingobium sp. Rr 2-17 TaxID=555793 RepID=UPI0002698BDA|nr:TonB-dependent receptor [Novosphingobium sp. Rr 2-17]EIZ78648.1 TonB-dependent receptor [Novosphingobium sp. Rr 2-17]
MRYTSFLFAGSAMMAVLSTTAYAQSGAVPTAPAPAEAQDTTTQNGSLEEIVVTAQKREQNLQDVPVAVSAISSEQIEARGVSAITDVARVSPSLTITENTNATGSSINLRGIGTFSFSIGIEPSVAIVVDDVALLQQAQAFSGLNDIERLEVLRGPQGTLFGKNAAAGVINIVTKAPTKQLSGSIGATATSDDQRRLEGMLSGPIGENVGFRINGFYDDRDGYIRNLNTGHMLNGERSYGARGRLDLDVTPTLDVVLTGNYTNTRSNGQVRTFRSVNSGASVFGAPISGSIVGIEPSDSNYTIRLDTEPLNVSKQAMFTGKATLDLGAANLISITAYQDWRFHFVEDLDTLGTPTLLNTADPTSILPNGSAATASFHAKNFTQELRLVSTGARRFDYLVALFYANGHTDRDYARGPNAAASWEASADTETFAAFAQGTYDFTDTTHLDAGVRFNREKIGATFLNTTAGAAAVANNGSCLAECRGRDSDNQVTYKASLRQDIAEQVMVYASYATGYKGQGFDISTGFTPARAANPVRPETSQAYEIGLKSRLFDNKLQLNLTGFWTDFKDFQAQGGVTLADGTIVPQLSNVGALRSRGVEAELSAKPTRLLRIDASAAYTDAKIREFANAPCYTGQTLAQGCVPATGGSTFQDLSGATLANSPKFKYNISANYDVEFPKLAFDGFITAEWAYQSKVKLDLLGSPISYQDAYGVFNGSVGIQGRDEADFRVALFVNNLFNQHYATSLGYTGSSNAQAVAQLLPRNSRRYVGIRTRVGF